MQEEWIKVYETTRMHQAVMIQCILEEHHIQSVLLNKQDSSYLTFGEIEVLVKLEQASDAVWLIDEEEN